MKDSQKIALITGITGQDGSYLAEFLLSKGYKVHGIKRRSSIINTQRIDHIFEENYVEDRNFILHYGDLTDSLSLVRLISEIKPDEIYNLGAQSHVAVSFEAPEYTANVDALGTLNSRRYKIFINEDNTKFYRASTSELYGDVLESPQSEKTPFNPQSPICSCKSYTPFGLQRIIGRVMVFLDATEFCLIMNLLEEARHLLQEK